MYHPAKQINRPTGRPPGQQGGQCACAPVSIRMAVPIMKGGAQAPGFEVRVVMSCDKNCLTGWEDDVLQPDAEKRGELQVTGSDMGLIYRHV